MQCSFCGYEYTMREMQADDPCPKCAEQLRLKVQAKEAQATKAKSDSAMAPHVKKVMDGYPGASPVVILDVNMSFNSMVWFMVKLVLASIPAFIILFVIFSVLFFMFPVLIPHLVGK